MSSKGVLALKSVATVAAMVLGALAQQHTFPALDGVFMLVAGFLGGSVHVPQPKAKVS
jgi:hypothetical protein